MSELILKDTHLGVPEITPDALALRDAAVSNSRQIVRVANPTEQSLAVSCLRSLKDLRNGMEASRKAIKAPVLALGKKIDAIAADFLQAAEREETRLQGFVNHYQRVLLREQQEREAQIARQAEEDRKLLGDLADELPPPSAPPIDKPKGLVVKPRLAYEVTNPHAFLQAYPDFWAWHPETETMKLKRRELLEELNNPKGEFFLAKFPEELPAPGTQIPRPIGLRVYEEITTHVR